MRNSTFRMAGLLLIVTACGLAMADHPGGDQAAPMKLSLDNAFAMADDTEAQSGSEQGTATDEELKLFSWQPKGFLTGLKGFESFVHPVSSPIYFFGPPDSSGP